MKTVWGYECDAVEKKPQHSTLCGIYLCVLLDPRKKRSCIKHKAPFKLEKDSQIRKGRQQTSKK